MKDSIESLRARIAQRVYAARIYPELTRNQIKLAEMRARSEYNQYPEELKEAMKQYGYEPGESKHYYVDFM